MEPSCFVRNRRRSATGPNPVPAALRVACHVGIAFTRVCGATHCASTVKQTSPRRWVTHPNLAKANEKRGGCKSEGATTNLCKAPVLPAEKCRFGCTEGAFKPPGSVHKPQSCLWVRNHTKPLQNEHFPQYPCMLRTGGGACFHLVRTPKQWLQSSLFRAGCIGSASLVSPSSQTQQRP